MLSSLAFGFGWLHHENTSTHDWRRQSYIPQKTDKFVHDRTGPTDWLSKYRSHRRWSYRQAMANVAIKTYAAIKNKQKQHLRKRRRRNKNNKKDKRTAPLLLNDLRLVSTIFSFYPSSSFFQQFQSTGKKKRRTVTDKRENIIINSCLIDVSLSS